MTAVAWSGLALCPSLLHGADATKKSYDLPAAEAAAAVNQFVKQSGEQVVFPADAVRGVQTNAVKGTFTAREALERMFAHTGFKVVEDRSTGALAVTADDPPPANPGAAAAAAVPAVQLSPFEVRTDADTGYDALQSNSVTAFRVDLNKMPATTTVFTQTFMDDVAATSVQDMLIRYTGTVGADPNNTGAALTMPGDRDGSGGGLGVRGLSAGAPKRDGFIGLNVLNRSSFGYTDTFSTGRVEVIEGPQSLLYGAVGGGGVVNIVSKEAHFDNRAGYLQTRVDRYGSKRAVLDYNFGRHRVAIRVATVGDSERNVRYNLGNQLYGLYAQAAFALGSRTTLRLFTERDSNWYNAAYNPSSGDLNNFLPAGDPRRGQDVRYLALTGQLADLQGRLWDGPVDYDHISSFGTWWSSERIQGKLSGLTLDSTLGHGLSLQLGAIYNETIDDRFTISKNLVPAAGLTGSGANPYNGTAVRISPGENWQSDRTKGVRFTLLHETDFHLGRLRGHSETAFGAQGSHQGPAFGSSGIDEQYYQADSNWSPIINPKVTTDYGRVPLGNLYYPVQGGIPLHPLFRPGSRRITLNGQNYVLLPRIYSDPSAATPDNPFGLLPNNPSKSNPNGFSGNWNRGGETHDREWYVANYTDWFDGRVITMAGVNVDRFTTLNVGPTRVTYLPPHDYTGYMVGANAQIKGGLRGYATLSTAGEAAGTTKDFYGDPLKVPKAKSPLPEVGLKYNAAGQNFSAQLAYDFATEVDNEAQNAGTTFFNAVNPNGINGRFNAGDQWINLNRKASALELVLTANPVKTWRMRFLATKLDGEVTNTVAFAQLYNDQFHAQGGAVTYADGSPVLVDPAAKGGPATTPLTLAMINNSSNPYWANPDPDSGSIRNSTLITALTAVNPAHGEAATGATGLPISAIQYNFSNPHQGVITVVESGDKTTGINEYTLNFQNDFTFDHGPLKGAGVFLDVGTYYKNRAYYTSYFPASASGNALQAVRVLYRLPTATVVGLNLHYSFKFGRYKWTTQLNVNNLFNHYRVWVVPNSGNGANLNGRLSTQPRQFIWTNTISF